MFGGTDLLSDPRAVFWNSYKACEDSAFEQATVDLTESVCWWSGRTLCYHKLEEAGWHEEAESSVTRMKSWSGVLLGFG
jgi:hypothetical protein